VQYAAPPEQQEVLAAVLNSVIAVLGIELLGRTNLGQGVLDFATMDACRLPVPDPATLPPDLRATLRAGLHAVWDAPLPSLLDPTYATQMAPINAPLLAYLGLPPGEADALVAETAALVAARVRKAATLPED
jgi:hypothetical protein